MTIFMQGCAMYSEPSKRNTQLNFNSLRGFWEPSPNRSEDQSVRSTPNSDQSASQSTLRDKKCDLVAIKQESPWKTYERIYELRLGLGHRVTVAENTDSSPGTLSNVVSIREFKEEDMKTKYEMLQYLQHSNLVLPLEIFWSKDIYYVISEHMPCSLHEVCGIEHLNEARIAAIIGQVSGNPIIW